MSDEVDDARYPSPAVLSDLLAQHGFDPDNLVQMIDMAAVGITVRWWRNTVVEDWHAGRDIGALSDADMYRINTHTTAKVRDRLRTWCRQQGVHTMSEIADADRDSLEAVVYNLYRWLTNPKRRLITGLTIYEVVARTLANARAHPDGDVPDDVTPDTEITAYREQVNMAAGYLLVCMDEHDPRSVFYTPAVASTTWATGWWCTPGYPSHVAAVFAALNNPDHEFWRGKPLPPPPAGTDLAKVQKLMVNRPWTVSEEVCEWLINEVGEHYIRD
ncbi:hypothetical protein [Micromonospora sp. NPDC005806]|uniref:hypothetical protein n=1 Tax=Micromonospora sp. NPDC005806 TaxID=3364234 RepID=UPI0036C1F25D